MTESPGCDKHSHDACGAKLTLVTPYDPFVEFVAMISYSNLTRRARVPTPKLVSDPYLVGLACQIGDLPTARSNIPLGNKSLHRFIGPIHGMERHTFEPYSAHEPASHTTVHVTKKTSVSCLAGLPEAVLSNQ